MEEVSSPHQTRAYLAAVLVDAHDVAFFSSTELQNTVKLPEGEDLNEWIAVNTVSRDDGLIFCENALSRRWLILFDFASPAPRFTSSTPPA